MREYLVMRKYPSYPTRADSILSRHGSQSAAQAEAIRLSKRLRGGAVSVTIVDDQRVTGYDMFIGGLLARYGRETSPKDWRSWHHANVEGFADHALIRNLDGR